MSRIISLRDLQRIPALSHMSEKTMIQLESDALINSYLAHLGFNINAAILYVPCNHRDMMNKTGVGFRAVGEITQDREYLTSRMCPVEERLIAASRRDMSLAKEMSKLMTSSTRHLSEEDSLEDENFPTEQIEDDYDNITQQIELLTMYRDAVRGTQYNESGALKTPSEYAKQ